MAIACDSCGDLAHGSVPGWTTRERPGAGDRRVPICVNCARAAQEDYESDKR
jgi:hypothetical protein